MLGLVGVVGVKGPEAKAALSVAAKAGVMHALLLALKAIGAAQEEWIAAGVHADVDVSAHVGADADADADTDTDTLDSVVGVAGGAFQVAPAPTTWAVGLLSSASAADAFATIAPPLLLGW